MTGLSSDQLYANGHAGHTVEHCIQDLLVIYKSSNRLQNLQESVFLRVVRSGDISTVQQVLQGLQNIDQTSILHWLLKTKVITTNKRNNFASNIVKTFVTILGFIVLVILYPVIYLCHGLWLHTCSKSLAWISDEPEHVLVMAALSENVSMLRILKDFGAEISKNDQKGNTVFHFLVNASNRDHLLAIRCTDLLISVFGNEARRTILTTENDFGCRQSLLLSLTTALPLSELPEDKINALMQDPFLKQYRELTINAFKAANGIRWLCFLGFCASILILAAYLMNGGGYQWQLKPYYKHYMNAAAENGAAWKSVAEKSCQPHDATTVNGVSLDACGSFAFGMIRDSCPSSISNASLLLQMGMSLNESELSVDMVKIFHDPMMEYIFVCVLISSGIQVIQIMHTFGQMMWSGRPVLTGLKMFSTRKLNGSYTSNQSAILMRIFVLLVWVLLTFIATGDMSQMEYLYVLDIGTIAVIMATLLSALCILHNCRFLPVIGQFILTLFAMGTVLFQFGVVMMSLVVLFGYLFRLFIRDENCPSVSDDGYATLTESIYSAYFLMLGMGSEPGNTNFETILLVSVYTVATMIILLNFIIAVMSALATNMMKQPWKAAISKNETLVMAMETEALLKTVCWPFFPVVQRYLRKRAGFRIRSRQGKWDNSEDKVNVEVELTK
ncbi:hypothetical protein CAPTEDRAFT_189709 [Capitella teleta]|uniref:Uncharacterized protein n=1 Tax=Capitella teleta TaxID=283909 RepID=R7TAM7_CAPTE|nr:hypothetical protein CAPTEDRAFT_189709 [Capitella teleta]|eukprot:ELT90759.1 hypothetical protein CAPTEDRAFT_189709 [Capitella teleta]